MLDLAVTMSWGGHEQQLLIKFNKVNLIKGVLRMSTFATKLEERLRRVAMTTDESLATTAPSHLRSSSQRPV